MPKEPTKIMDKDQHQPQIQPKVRMTACVLTVVLCSLFLFDSSANLQLVLVRRYLTRNGELAPGSGPIATSFQLHGISQ